MKSILKASLIFLFVMNLSEIKAQEQKTEFDNHFTHVVYFWLKNPDSAEDKKAFLTSLKNFMSKSEYAKTKFIGEPAGTSRDVVDGSFTYSLILSFPSKEVQDKYQKEAPHVKFVEESQHLWERVVVYDSVGI
ncbi:Dabb family protein [Confluentibacter flavum]|uniref:Stress responsive protein n=1 Tax=Confluentibacter flavum TaxID=1909700 RepID=A0A2N3HI56_9FLAO|nr:Dabb family protein [Confluentibacter flavum]PKQ44670.1 stress responsive protein [Confluentibacter flavum]